MTEKSRTLYPQRRESMMDEKKRVFTLMFILAGACLLIAGITIALLYQTAFEEQREVLVATAQSQARLIEAMADFDSKNSPEYPGGSEKATLSQIIEAHKKYRGIGETGEFTLAKREGDNIVFLLSHRYHDYDTPQPVLMNSELAEPMRRALSGFSGTMIGLDYRGKTVLAAYEPVAGTGYGIVAKIDLEEIRAPFIEAGFSILIITLTVVFSGSLLFLYTTDPIMKRVREDSQRLKEYSENLELLIASLRESEKNLKRAHDEMETRVKERTRELASANENLLIESRKRAKAEERLRALWEIAAMANCEDRELYSAVLSGITQITKSRYAFLGFLSSDESVLENITWSQTVFKDCGIPEKTFEYSISKAGIWSEAVRRNKVIVVNDYAGQDFEKRELPEGHIPMKRFLVLPVHSNGRVAAILVAANKETDYLHEDVMQLDAFMSGVQLILDQREAKTRLTESEKKYSSLVENSLTGIYISTNGEVLFANSRFAEMHGYTVGEVVGMEPRIFVHPEDRSYFKTMSEEVLPPKGMSSGHTLRRVKKDGEILWTTNSNTRIQYQGNPAIVWNINDITQRVQLEEALRESEKEYRLLSQQILKTLENEKKGLAREIHDGINQSLAALKFRLEDYLILTEQKTGETPNELLSVIEMIQNTMEEVRRIQNDLRPSGLDELGILLTATDFCEEFQETYPKLEIERRFDISESDIPEELKAPIFRILQEAMHNSVKHSQAGRIEVKLLKYGSVVELTVEDNGIGFRDIHPRVLSTGTPGLGLFSMRERAELSGGSLEIRSSPETGTVIRAFWML
jgi:PAS domain S-box-containing protein